MSSSAKAGVHGGASRHHTADEVSQRVVHFFLSDWSLSVLLVFLAISVFIVRPLAVLGFDAHLLASLVFTIMLLSGIATVARSRRTAIGFGIVVVLAVSLHWARVLIFGETLLGIDAAAGMFACGTLAAIVLAQVFREGPITTQRIQGAIAAYLLVAIAFAAAFTWVDLHIANAFVGAPAITTLQHDPMQRFVYFSFVTLTTVGYGDITPVAPIACSLAMLEALLGQLFPSILLARLVSMELYYRQRQFESEQAKLDRQELAREVARQLRDSGV
jgi:hypothetical protein